MRKNKDTLTNHFKKLKEKLPPRRHDQGAQEMLVVDGMGIVHAAYNSYRGLSSGGSSTSLLFGVPQMIKSLLKRFPGSKIIICWDGKHHPKRLELLPGYKSHRQKKRDPKDRALMEKQIKKVRKLLFYMGIPQAYDIDVEGDDMLYFVYREKIKAYYLRLVTGDKDFIQLINYDCQIYNPRTNSPIDVHGCPGDIPVPVFQHVDYLCLTGDESDDIPGYRGCGPKTAQKFLKQFDSINQYLKSDEDFAGLNDKDKLREIYHRNRLLIDLKRFCNLHYPEDYRARMYRGRSSPTFDEARYRQMCTRYRLKTMLYPAFIEFIKTIE